MLVIFLESDYEPESNTKLTSQKGTPTRKRRNSDSRTINRVKDDGLVSCYKTRLEQYYKQLEIERSVLNREADNDEEHIMQGGLKIPLGVWKNLYR